MRDGNKNYTDGWFDPDIVYEDEEDDQENLPRIHLTRKQRRILASVKRITDSGQRADENNRSFRYRSSSPSLKILQILGCLDHGPNGWTVTDLGKNLLLPA